MYVRVCVLVFQNYHLQVVMNTFISWIKGQCWKNIINGKKDIFKKRERRNQGSAELKNKSVYI